MIFYYERLETYKGELYVYKTDKQRSHTIATCVVAVSVHSTKACKGTEVWLHLLLILTVAYIVRCSILGRGNHFALC